MQLNRDVYAYFASFVSSTKDLLALCLTNKEFLDLALPELEYRSIRCKLNNDALWIQLASNPVQASRIRSLEIGYSNILVPKSLNVMPPIEEDERASDSALESNYDFDSYPDRMDGTRKAAKQSEYLLVQAIKKMLNLESFLWDLGPPLIHLGAEEEGTVYEEDMWTNLRDYTSLKSLTVLDLPDHFVRSTPILNSSIFTLKDMTSLDLTFFHSPEGHLDGGNHAQLTGNILKNGRVKIDGIKAITKQCPRLERLSLAVIDRQFFYEFGGNPYTNITTVLRDAHWPELTLLKFHDITIDDTVMTNFLLRHNKLETLSVSLSVTDLPILPFHISSQVDISEGFLPNLKAVTSDAALTRQILRALKQTSFLQSINSIEPRDWNIKHDAFLAPPHVFIHELAIQIIDIPIPMMNHESVVLLPPNDSDDTEPEHILRRMPDLRSLVIRNINRFDDLNDLPDLTPNLENIECNSMHRFFDASSFSCGNVLPILKRWKRLRRFTGVSLWLHEEFVGVIDVNSEPVLTVAREIKAALPLIEEMTWWDGQLVKFKVDDGKFFLEKEQSEFGEY